jgi:signal transduction histidine kinase
MFGLKAAPVETSLDGFRRSVHPADRAMIDASIAQSVETDAPYRVEFRVVWSDGTVRWIVSKGRVFRESTGTPTAMMGISTDVTDRKDLERQLHHAQKMESLGRLAGGIAHDFNNVLTAILGFSELLLEDLDSAHARNVLEIRKASETGQRLTRQLLAFSRQQPVEPTPLDLNESVTTTAAILQRLSGQSVRLDTCLNSFGCVWADRGQVEQILANLVTNARDAMPHGGCCRIETSNATITHHMASRENVHGGEYVMLAVIDAGVGMPPETQARIFEPFFTTKAPGMGTGFGLATVYGIVRQSNGFIEVSSTVGQGTTFRIYLPRVENS